MTDGMDEDKESKLVDDVMWEEFMKWKEEE